MHELFGFDAFLDWPDLAKLMVRLGFNLLVATVVIRLIYYRRYRNRDYLFTYYVFNIITFSLCFLLRKVPAELGFALAIFGVFGILRYRTEQILIRDLTYLFICIGVAIVNAVSNHSISLAELSFVNLAIVITAAWVELAPRSDDLATPMTYDRIDLLQPGKESELCADLSRRTGSSVGRVTVQSVDLLRDSAEVVVFHRRPR